jgi:hypothetical protein
VTDALAFEREPVVEARAATARKPDRKRYIESVEEAVLG